MSEPLNAIYDYFGADLWAVWVVVENNLPYLELQVANILEKDTIGG